MVGAALFLPLVAVQSAYAEPAEVEPNDTAATATAIGVGTANALSASIAGAGDIDQYAFVAPASGTFIFDVFESASSLGPLNAWGCCGYNYASLSDAGLPSITSVNSVLVPAVAGETYTLVVSASVEAGWPEERTGTYRVRVLPGNELGAERDSRGEPNGNTFIGQPISPGTWVTGEISKPDARFFERAIEHDTFTFPMAVGPFTTAYTRSATPKSVNPGRSQHWEGTSGNGWIQGSSQGSITVTGGDYGAFEVCVESWGSVCHEGVRRIFGSDRYSTSAKISATFPRGVPVAVVATGTNFPDALAGTALAARLGGPVILVPKTGIPSAVADEIRRLQPRKIIVIGSEDAVSAQTYLDLMNLLPIVFSDSMMRLAGSDRYETAAKIAAWMGTESSGTVVIATGLDFPDALSGAALAAMYRSPILLTRPDRLDALTQEQLWRFRPKEIVVLGGTDKISDELVSQLQSFISFGGTVTRIAGTNRFETSALVAAKFPFVPAQAFVTTGYRFPDALAGAGRAAWTGAPTLLVPGTSIPPTIDTQLRRITPGAITVLGGTDAVSTSVEQSLAQYLR